mmetsp:Transcript_6416/g.17416  ORF Transcript_6416/g.17416 Transcript_6416/m.17416 type:complete len:179 (+) Transcript_6416:133-669(+)
MKPAPFCTCVISLMLVARASSLVTPSPRHTLGRRSFAGLAPSALLFPALAARAEENEKALITELVTIRKSLDKVPDLIDAADWDGARTILKNPPVANLWNLGASKNTIRKLAAARGDDVEVIEFTDDVAGALQLADQFCYDNVFIYFQPGNGKAKVKEPKDQVKIAKAKLDELLQLVQ